MAVMVAIATMGASIRVGEDELSGGQYLITLLSIGGQAFILHAGGFW
jgi:hypothetical protein